MPLSMVRTYYEQVYWAAKGNRITFMVLVRKLRMHVISCKLVKKKQEVPTKFSAESQKMQR